MRNVPHRHSRPSKGGPVIKALTIRQPWATLVALGVKQIETRSWRAPASLIGQHFAIHAGTSLAGMDALDGDCEGMTEAGWRYGYIGSYQASYCYRSSDEGHRGETWMVKDDASDPAPDYDGPLPLGAIVATARLVDCVPITAPGHLPLDPPDGWASHVSINPVTGHLRGYWTGHTQPLWAVEDLSDQLPYGDFTPRRWAWLLDDVKPTTERCPACMGSGKRQPFPGGSACPRCRDWPGQSTGVGTCPPIPAKGRQGLWTWAP